MANLRGVQVIDTGPFPAQRFGWSEPRNLVKRWTNDSGAVLDIWQVQVWLGMDIGGRGDFWFTLSRASDGSVLALTNWDHYRDPTGPHAVHMDYAPNPMTLEPGDALVLVYGARRWNPLWPVVMRAHVSVTIWFTEAFM